MQLEVENCTFLGTTAAVAPENHRQDNTINSQGSTVNKEIRKNPYVETK